MQRIKSVSLNGFNEAYSSSTLVLLKPIERLANIKIRKILLLSDFQLVRHTVLQLLTAAG